MPISALNNRGYLGKKHGGRSLDLDPYKPQSLNGTCEGCIFRDPKARGLGKLYGPSSGLYLALGLRSLKVASRVLILSGLLVLEF